MHAAVTPALPLARSPGTPPRRLLASLAAGVLLAHLALLDTLPLDWMAPTDRATSTGPLITRRLPAPVSAEPTATPTVATPSAVRQRPTPAPAKASAPPTPTEAAPRPALPLPSMGAAPATVQVATEEPEPAPSIPAAPQTPASAPEPATLALATTQDSSHHVPSKPTTLTTPSASALAAESGRPPHAAIPAPTKLLYSITGEAKRLTYSARSELFWQHDGRHYDARLDITVFLLGTRTQASRGELRPDGLAPQRFADKSRTELAAHVERDKGKISFSANTPDIALLPGAQDRLSLMLQLAALVQGEPQRYPPGTRIPVQTIGPRDADLWEIVVSRHETLELPYGTPDTLKPVLTPRREFDQKLELWLAPALGHLPVRIRLTQANGDFVDQQLRATEVP